MAELVDALDSKSCIRKDVQVRFLFWALKFQGVTFIRSSFFFSTFSACILSCFDRCLSVAESIIIERKQ